MSAARAAETTGATPRLERIVGIVLRLGVVISSVCLGAGGVLSLVAGWNVAATFLLQTGIVVLLATPVARVIVSIVEYVSARDWTFATLTAIVLVELLASAVAALVFNHRL
jgi:uncharacterized membrane protein